MKCEHKDFTAHVVVTRIEDVKGFFADIRVKCADCGLPFEFVGVDAGLSYEKPMASVDAQELRAPIRPKGCKILPAVPGFNVRAV